MFRGHKEVCYLRSGVHAFQRAIDAIPSFSHVFALLLLLSFMGLSRVLVLFRISGWVEVLETSLRCLCPVCCWSPGGSWCSPSLLVVVVVVVLHMVFLPFSAGAQKTLRLGPQSCSSGYDTARVRPQLGCTFIKPSVGCSLFSQRPMTCCSVCGSAV